MTIILKFILFLISFTSTFIILVFSKLFYNSLFYKYIRLFGLLPIPVLLNSIHFSPIILTLPQDQNLAY
jgi:hypothetical protein